MILIIEFKFIIVKSQSITLYVYQLQQHVHDL